MHRKPSPSELLAFKKILSRCSMVRSDVVVLRGNHDSETKADDGVTALSLLSKARSKDCNTYLYKQT
jgi:DNA repair exonuclease SbcCD nuclease subunit